mgnify:CR=1 FL=1
MYGDGARRVRISGSDIIVRARSRRIDTYSAHADRDELRTWIAQRAPITGGLFLTHGEPGSMSSLTALISEDSPRLPIVTPAIGEKYLLTAGAPATLVAPGRPDAARLIGRDWQNDYAEFALGLKEQLTRIPDTVDRQKAVAEMNRILQTYAAAPPGHMHSNTAQSDAGKTMRKGHRRRSRRVRRPRIRARRR